MSELNKFNFVSPFYDFLARLIFGKSIFDAQKHFISELPERGNLLILGGGTGWIIDEIAQIKKLKIYYVEASEKMLVQARIRKAVKSSDVLFIHGTEDSIPAGVKFNAVITNFFLDLFTEKELAAVTGKIRKRLEKDATWIVTDFVGRSRWNRFMTRVMYYFFRITAGLKTQKLPDWEAHMLLQLKPVRSVDFSGGFIRTTIYR